MRRIFKKILVGLIVIGCHSEAAKASSSEDLIKRRMVADLDIIKHALDIQYAPQDWKKFYAGWDLEAECTKAKDRVWSLSPPSVKQFHQIVKDFLSTTQDYHVKAVFLSTESATLPFIVKGIGERYFIDWIDQKRLTSDVYSIHVGDEVLEFDHRPINEVIQDLKDRGGFRSNPQTDQSLAELKLTSRVGRLGDVVPKGSSILKIRSAQGLVRSYQLSWDYQLEQIRSPFEYLAWHSPLADWALQWYRSGEPRIGHTHMMSPLKEMRVDRADSDIRGLGSYYSFVPKLGLTLWSHEKSPFYAYIYLNSQKRKIGYIRIPHYEMNDPEDFKAFGEIIQQFEKETEALVIDQVNNYGGLVRTEYTLVSMLTNRPLSTPRHRIMITQQDVAMALSILDFLEIMRSDQDVRQIFQGSSSFETYQTVLFLKSYYQFIIDEWNAGHLLTDPIHVEGVDFVNPHPSCCYTKPILVLINELDFSGGDFFPAIMQDNQRALLFGTKTAGAGGFVIPLSFPNANGIDRIYYTASIAERLNHQPIENLAVVPDIEYQLTEADVRGGYRQYRSAVNAVVSSLLPSDQTKLIPAKEESKDEAKDSQASIDSSSEQVDSVMADNAPSETSYKF